MALGRPQIILDKTRIRDYAANGMIMSEIAAIMNVSEQTLRNNYFEDIKIGRELLCGRLRMKQVELAEAGNTTMLVWLGKNLLNQSDRSEIKVVEELGFGDFAQAVVAGADKSDATATRVH